MTLAANTDNPSPRYLTDVRMADAAAASQFAEKALARDKQESLDLAVKVRWAALAAVAVLLPFVNPSWSVLYYEGLLLCFAATAYIQRRIGIVGQSRAELALIFTDLLLLWLICIFPNPFTESDFPWAMQFRFQNFLYFFVLLAGATLIYSWRTVFAMGTWTVALWIIGIFVVWWQSGGHPELTEAIKNAFSDNALLISLLDPNAILYGFRAQEIVVFVIVAFTLSQTVRRSNRLLIGHASLERERANLARYFSPNVVEELSQNDEPLKVVRTQNVAVMFVDIVGFTKFSADRSPEDVINTLRLFHGRMEREVFAHAGTLDKYLGDGLMATFGTPISSPKDATNAFQCALRMQEVVAEWNRERQSEGDQTITASVGVHYGPVVLGDIGSSRLEFAVIGNTVNVANRLENLTRELQVEIAVSDELIKQAIAEDITTPDQLKDWAEIPGQTIRGLTNAVTVWTHRSA